MRTDDFDLRFYRLCGRRTSFSRRDGHWSGSYPLIPSCDVVRSELTSEDLPQVTHGPNPTPSAGSINAKNFDNLPRVFSQSFILVFVEASVGVGGYQIAADSFRFC